MISSFWAYGLAYGLVAKPQGTRDHIWTGDGDATVKNRRAACSPQSA